MMVAGVGSIVKGVSDDAAQKQLESTQNNARALQQAQLSLNQNLDPNMLNRQFGGGVDAAALNQRLGPQISKIQGGTGSPDSIRLGDIAMVDNNEVKYGGYIFSNEIDYDG